MPRRQRRQGGPQRRQARVTSPASDRAAPARSSTQHAPSGSRSCPWVVVTSPRHGRARWSLSSGYRTLEDPARYASELDGLALLSPLALAAPLLLLVLLRLEAPQIVARLLLGLLGAAL